VLPVRLAPRAFADLERLPRFLAVKSESAGERARGVLEAAIASLGEFPERGRRAPNGPGRELVVPFGDAGYLLRYRVRKADVLVTRIRHAREQR